MDGTVQINIGVGSCDPLSCAVLSAGLGARIPAFTFLQHTLLEHEHYCTTQHDHLTSLPRYVMDQISFVVSRESSLLEVFI